MSSERRDSELKLKREIDTLELLLEDLEQQIKIETDFKKKIKLATKSSELRVKQLLLKSELTIRSLRKRSPPRRSPPKPMTPSPPRLSPKRSPPRLSPKRSPLKIQPPRLSPDKMLDKLEEKLEMALQEQEIKKQLPLLKSLLEEVEKNQQEEKDFKKQLKLLTLHSKIVTQIGVCKIKEIYRKSTLK